MIRLFIVAALLLQEPSLEFERVTGGQWHGDHLHVPIGRIRTEGCQAGQIANSLARLPGVTVFPSRTNFVLARVPDAPRRFEALRAAGILVKNRHGVHPLLEHCLRITVGAPNENEALLAAFAAADR